MSFNVVNVTPFMRTSREFPDDIKNLTVELNRSFIETANVVNARTIGLFPTNLPALTGESWYILNNRKQQTLRQVFPFGAIAPGGTLNIPYTLFGFNQFSKIYGTCITGFPDYRPIPYASVVANANIDLRVSPTNIIVAVGAASPAITSGLIIIEWLSQV